MPRLDRHGGDAADVHESAGMTEAAMPPARNVQKVAVFGLGYVGSVSAACLASRGHSVIGVDVRSEKVDMINQGRSPVVEERLGDLVAEQVAAGRLCATTDSARAVANTDIALVCVGTPSASNGSLMTGFLERVSEEIGAALAGHRERYTVVVRSTMLPSTCEHIVLPRLQAASGMRAGEDFGLAVNPEFLREGTSVRDFFDPPKVVIGQFDEASGDAVADLYEGLPGPVYRVPLAVAEMIKYADNSFHALKVGFANEMGAVCKALGLDSHAVMDMLIADTKLNISPAYLRPGFAFGGSCLPKDLRAVVHCAGGPTCQFLSWRVSAPPTRVRLTVPSRSLRPPASVAWGCSASPSSRARTICARARWWPWPSVLWRAASSC